MQNRGKGKEKLIHSPINFIYVLQTVHTNDSDLFLSSIEESLSSLPPDELKQHLIQLSEYAESFNRFEIVAAIHVVTKHPLSPLAERYFAFYQPKLHTVFEKSNWRKTFKVNLPTLPASEVGDYLECFAGASYGMHSILDSALTKEFVTGTVQEASGLEENYRMLFGCTDPVEIQKKVGEFLQTSTHITFLQTYWEHVYQLDQPELINQVLIFLSYNPNLKSIVTQNPADVYQKLYEALFLLSNQTPETQSAAEAGFQALLVLGLKMRPIILSLLSKDKFDQIKWFTKCGWSPLTLSLELWTAGRGHLEKLAQKIFNAAMKVNFIIDAIVHNQKSILHKLSIYNLKDFPVALAKQALIQRNWFDVADTLNTIEAAPEDKEPVSNPELQINLIVGSLDTALSEFATLEKELGRYHPAALTLLGIIAFLATGAVAAVSTQFACLSKPTCHKEGIDQLVFTGAHSFCNPPEIRLNVAANVNCTNYNTGPGYPHHASHAMLNNTTVKLSEDRTPLYNLTEKFSFEADGDLTRIPLMTIILSLIALAGVTFIATVSIRTLSISHQITSDKFRTHYSDWFCNVIDNIERRIKLHLQLLDMRPTLFADDIEGHLVKVSDQLAVVRKLFIFKSAPTPSTIMKEVHKLSTIMNKAKAALKIYREQLSSLKDEWQAIIPGLQLQLNGLAVEEPHTNQPAANVVRLFAPTRRPNEQTPLLSINTTERVLEEGIAAQSTSSSQMR